MINMATVNRERTNCSRCGQNVTDSFFIIAGTAVCNECASGRQCMRSESGHAGYDAGTMTVIWRCPFCEEVIRLGGDETEQRLLMLDHRVELHRFRISAMHPS